MANAAGSLEQTHSVPFSPPSILTGGTNGGAPVAAILIVDDDKNQRLLLEEELQSDGYTTYAVATGRDAIDVASRTMPDVAVLDIRMPGMDGPELMGRLLSMNHHLRIVIYTGYACHQDNFMAWAADAYVMKRSDLSELKGAIRRVIASSARSRQDAAPRQRALCSAGTAMGQGGEA